MYFATARSSESRAVEEKVFYSNARCILGLRDPEPAAAKQDEREAVPV